MKIRNGDTPIQLPDTVRVGDPITARWANGLRAAVQRLRDRTPVINYTRIGKKELRFDVILLPQPDTDPQTYKVRVTDGRVIEIDRTKGDNEQAMILHEANNRTTAGEPTEFDIAIDEAIYIYVPETDNGAIDGTNVSIVIEADDQISTNYIPTVIGGEYYYKLAELRTIDGQARIVPFCSGSNIFHETGLNADYRVMSCPDPVDPEAYPQTQHARLRFCGGRLAGIDEDPATIPLSSNIVEYNVETCT